MLLMSLKFNWASTNYFFLSLVLSHFTSAHNTEIFSVMRKFYLFFYGCTFNPKFCFKTWRGRLLYISFRHESKNICCIYPYLLKTYFVNFIKYYLDLLKIWKCWSLCFSEKIDWLLLRFSRLWNIRFCVHFENLLPARDPFVELCLEVSVNY